MKDEICNNHNKSITVSLCIIMIRNGLYYCDNTKFQDTTHITQNSLIINTMMSQGQRITISIGSFKNYIGHVPTLQPGILCI